MSGYFEFSKSNNAVAAEHSGSFPASVLAARLGVKAGAIRELVPTDEWHHTSKMYNCTDYFSEETAMERIEELRAWQEPAKLEAELTNCSGKFLEWGGTRSHPVAKEVTFAGIPATRKGKWITLQLASGPVRKALTTRGFEIKSNGKWVL